MTINLFCINPPNRHKVQVEPFLPLVSKNTENTGFVFGMELADSGLVNQSEILYSSSLLQVCGSGITLMLYPNDESFLCFSAVNLNCSRCT